MTGIGDQGHRVGYKSKSTLDDHEKQVQRHRDGHSPIDDPGRDSMSVATTVRMPTILVGVGAMVMPGVVGSFHWPILRQLGELTSVARRSAYATAMGTTRVPITRRPAGWPPR